MLSKSVRREVWSTLCICIVLHAKSPSTPNTSARSLITHTSINFTHIHSILCTTYQEVAAFLEGCLLISFLSSQTCRYYLKGQCGYGANCRYDHVKPKESRGEEEPKWAELSSQLKPAKPCYGKVVAFITLVGTNTAWRYCSLHLIEGNWYCVTVF